MIESQVPVWCSQNNLSAFTRAKIWRTLWFQGASVGRQIAHFSGSLEPLQGVITHLLPPDRQIRRLTRLSSTGFGSPGLDLAIQAEQGEQLSQGLSRPTNILIVDDDSAIAKTLRFILEDEGYQVALAEDGPAAIERVRQVAFDLILMDVKLPRMNGVEVYKAVKRISPGSRVIMMTAYALENLIQQALREGALGVFYKPLDIPAMLQFMSSYRRN